MNKIILTATLPLFLAACAGGQIANHEALSQKATERAGVSTMTPQQAIQSASELMSKASLDQLHFYAPLHMDAATKSYENAQSLMAKKATNQEVLAAAFKTEATIKDAVRAKQIVETTLAASLKHKQILDDLGVQADLPKDYRSVMKDLKKLIVEVGKGNIEKASKDQPDLLADMTELEKDTLLKRHLAPAEDMLDKAEDYDADDNAPKTYELAEDTIERIEGFIKQQYRDMAAVKAAGEEAFMAAKHAYHVGVEAGGLLELSPEDAEDKILKFEGLLKTIGQSLNAKPTIGNSLYDQAQLLSSTAEKLRSKQAQPVAIETTNSIEAGGEEVEVLPNQDAVEQPLDVAPVESDQDGEGDEAA